MNEKECKLVSQTLLSILSYGTPHVAVSLVSLCKRAGLARYVTTPHLVLPCIPPTVNFNGFSYTTFLERRKRLRLHFLRDGVEPWDGLLPLSEILADLSRRREEKNKVIVRGTQFALLREGDDEYILVHKTPYGNMQYRLSLSSLPPSHRAVAEKEIKAFLRLGDRRRAHHWHELMMLFASKGGTVATTNVAPSTL